MFCGAQQEHWWLQLELLAGASVPSLDGTVDSCCVARGECAPRVLASLNFLASYHACIGHIIGGSCWWLPEPCELRPCPGVGRLPATCSWKCLPEFLGPDCRGVRLVLRYCGSSRLWRLARPCCANRRSLWQASCPSPPG
jgi:hypothetical protein